jgi:spermidine/putrescine transport system substrate-binding protein
VSSNDAQRFLALTRRDLLIRSCALGAGWSALAPLLAGCGGEREKTPLAEGALEPELRIYNWSDYIAEDTIPGFEKEFGVQVTYDTFESNEEMVAKLQAGASGYDLVVPSGYVVPVLAGSDLLAPIDRSLLSNLPNLAPLFRGLPSDPEDRYTVPWQWGTSGIAYRTDKLEEAPDSWGVFQQAEHSGRMTMMDDGREVLGAMLRFRGHSLNSVDPGELAQARTDAIEAKKHLLAYVSAPVKAQLVSGDVWIAQLWNGDTAQARKEQPQLAYVIPREGCTIWVDSLVIPASAPHKRAAHAFIDYILRPEIGAAISNFTGYGTPNQAAAERLTTPVPYPSPEELARLEYSADLGAGTELWDRIFTEVKSA